MSDDQHLRLSVGGGDSVLDQRLSDELDAYDLPAANAGEQREFSVRLEDETGQLVAGLSGWTLGTSAGIAMVWVHQDRRRSGLGARLLEAAEAIARERDCERINVSSFTFQAPAFYAKNGYAEVGRTEALPVAGHADVHFVKHLSQVPLPGPASVEEEAGQVNDGHRAEDVCGGAAGIAPAGDVIAG